MSADVKKAKMLFLNLQLAKKTYTQYNLSVCSNHLFMFDCTIHRHSWTACTISGLRANDKLNENHFLTRPHALFLGRMHYSCHVPCSAPFSVSLLSLQVYLMYWMLSNECLIAEAAAADFRWVGKRHDQGQNHSLLSIYS